MGLVHAGKVWLTMHTILVVMIHNSLPLYLLFENA